MSNPEGSAPLIPIKTSPPPNLPSTRRRLESDPSLKLPNRRWSEGAVDVDWSEVLEEPGFEDYIDFHGVQGNRGARVCLEADIRSGLIKPESQEGQLLAAYGTADYFIG
jgi:hypothetical protein